MLSRLFSLCQEAWEGWNKVWGMFKEIENTGLNKWYGE